MDDLALAAEFPKADRDQWLNLVQAVLKGADFEKRLVSRTYDGIRIEPLYPKADNASPVPRGEHARWRISQRIDHPDPNIANELALADLEGGADALTLVVQGAPAARGFGLGVTDVDALDRALAGVMLDLVHVRLDAGGRGRQVAAMLIALAERRGHDLSDLSFDLGLDPIGAMAATGKLSAPWEVVAKRCANTLSDLVARRFQGRAFLADGRPYHEGGGSEAQELAAALATGVSYLRALEAGGHTLDTARRALSFLLVADADEFLTVAKFRALRKLWARVEQACGLDPKPIRLHAETAWRMTTRRDPWVNMLRTTVAVFSAGIGGADAVTVLPFTSALGLPDAFARRIARNTQSILLDESNLWRVADPVAGAGGFEALTEALCEKAWSLFQELEREGGIVASLAASKLQERIASTRAARAKAIATRKEPITGTSEFPDIRETPVQVLMTAPAGTADVRATDKHRQENVAISDSFGEQVAAAAGGASLTELLIGGKSAGALDIPALSSVRASEPFERLRDLSDSYMERHGNRPKVFLANLGPVAAFTARSTFAKNFFAAAGIEAVSSDEFSSLDEINKAYQGSDAKLACICSSDDIYQEHAVFAAKTLREAGCNHIYLAGRPGELEEALKRVGLQAFIFAGCDTLRTLAEALDAACA